MNNLKEILFTINYVYWQMLFACIFLILMLIIFRLSQTIVIKSGMYLFAACVTINFVLSLFSVSYWYFILHWFLSSLSFFIFWYCAIYICERYGQPYSGDGGMIIILPVYILPVCLLVSIVFKSAAVLIQRF